MANCRDCGKPLRFMAAKEVWQGGRFMGESEPTMAHSGKGVGAACRAARDLRQRRERRIQDERVRRFLGID